MIDYEPNSHAYKAKKEKAAEKKNKVEKVVTGKTKIKKKSASRKFADVFVSEDVSNVKSYILSDVMIPAIKNLVADIVQDGINMILFGGTKRNSKRPGFRPDYISYDRFSSNKSNDHRSANEPRKTGYNYDDIILETRGEAEAVLSSMDELIDMYGTVSVGDLYDLVGITGNYTDEKYGWTNIRNAEPIRVRDGYMLKLPKVLPIDN